MFSMHWTNLLTSFCFYFLLFQVKKLKEKYDKELNEHEKEHSTSLSILKSQHEEMLHGTNYNVLLFIIS